MLLHVKKIELVPVKEFKPSKRNPNHHTAEQIERIALRLKEHGWRLPIVVSNQSGLIVAGHGRLLAAKHNQWDKVPVSYQDFDSEDMEYAFMIADNALSEGSELDLSMINSELENLGPDIDLDSLGIKDFKLDLAETLEPEKKKKPCPNCGYTA